MVSRISSLIGVGVISMALFGGGAEPWPFGRGEMPATTIAAATFPAEPPAPATIDSSLKQAVPDPLEAIRSQLPAVDQPFTLVVSMELKPGAETEFERLAAAAAAGTHKEPGSLVYEFSRAAGQPRKIVLYERWRSFADIKKHFEFDYVKNLLGKTGEFTVSGPAVAVYLPLSGSASK